MNQGINQGLSTLFRADGGATGVFSDKAADYLASRPDYPAGLFERLQALCPPRPSTWVADLGAGSGQLSQGLLAHGYSVIAVEPNQAMRNAAELSLRTWANFRSVDGCAERIPLPDASVDLVTAAHSFHWFDAQAARAECLRVLRPAGQVALIWNDRLLSDPLHQALDELFAEFGGDKRAAVTQLTERGDLPAFFGSATMTTETWPHEHWLQEPGLISLVFSRSYMPKRDSTAGHAVRARLSELYHRFATNQGLSVRYQTVAYLGRPWG